MIIIPLEHVCRWTASGWVQTSIDEIKKLHPFGISEANHILRCELCGQPVAFRPGSSSYSPHFKHARSDIPCIEKTDSYYYHRSFREDYWARLPLAIVSYNKSDITFGIGIPLPPSLSKQQIQNLKIYIGTGKNIKTYNGERLRNDSITYLHFSNLTSESIHVSLNSTIKNFHFSNVDPFKKKGTVFKCISSRSDVKAIRLSPYAPVYLNQEYLILVSIENTYLISSYISFRDSIQIASAQASTMIGDKTWILYKVQVTKYTQFAVDFFLMFDMRLVDREEKVVPLWPPYFNGVYITRYFGSKLWLSVPEDYTLALYPQNQYFWSRSESDVSVLCTSPNHRIESIATEQKDQLVSFGKKRELDFVYLENAKGSANKIIPDLNVYCDNHLLTDYINRLLPSDTKHLEICAQYDGKITIFRDDKVFSILKFKSSQLVTVPSFTKGDVIEIRIGLDLAARLRIDKPLPKAKSSDLQAIHKIILSNRNDNILIPADFRNLIPFFKNDPVIYQWMIKVIQHKVVSAAKYKHLKATSKKLSNGDFKNQ